jgi:hypothetical protein
MEMYVYMYEILAMAVTREKMHIVTEIVVQRETSHLCTGTRN